MCATQHVQQIASFHLFCDIACSGEVGGPERFFFPALQTLNLRSSGIVQGGTNSRGEHLPEGFAFVECAPLRQHVTHQQHVTRGHVAQR